MNRYGYEAFSELAETRPPEKALLAAVLERAYRDLGFSVRGKDKNLLTAVHLERKSAVLWFNSLEEPDYAALTFSFTEVKEELGLSPSFLEYLREHVKKAEIVLEQEAEEIRKLIAHSPPKYVRVVKSTRKYERKIA